MRLLLLIVQLEKQLLFLINSVFQRARAPYSVKNADYRRL
jgi:hypothetical protein